MLSFTAQLVAMCKGQLLTAIIRFRVVILDRVNPFALWLYNTLLVIIQYILPSCSSIDRIERDPLTTQKEDI